MVLDGGAEESGWVMRVGVGVVKVKGGGGRRGDEETKDLSTTQTKKTGLHQNSLHNYSLPLLAGSPLFLSPSLTN